MKLSGKKNEIKERLNVLLSMSETLITEKGFDNFKLEDLTEPSGFSRGTIYLTFKTKDVLLAMLAIKSLEKWLGLISKALNHSGNTREKLLAIYISHIILVNIAPSGYSAIQFMGQSINQSRIPTDFVNTINKNIDTIISSIEQLVNIAIAKKELTLPSYITSAELATNLFTDNLGAMSFSLSRKDNSKHDANIHLTFIRLLLDRLLWLPISNLDEREDDTAVMLFAKVFPAEFNQINP